MNQHEWVYGCYAYYLENYIEPGNPEDGEWQDCHWPVPKCKGGSKTILLLKEHHAVHGVLQSEEWQHPCVYGWERHYLTGNLLTLYKKWKSEGGRIGSLSITFERRSEASKKKWVKVTPEERTQFGREMAAKRDPEKMRRVNTANGLATNTKLNTVKWRCTVTGYVSTAGPLTRYQHARGIDPSNRERLVD